MWYLKNKTIVLWLWSFFCIIKRRCQNVWHRLFCLLLFPSSLFPLTYIHSRVNVYSIKGWIGRAYRLLSGWFSHATIQWPQKRNGKQVWLPRHVQSYVHCYYGTITQNISPKEEFLYSSRENAIWFPNYLIHFSNPQGSQVIQINS